MSSVIGCSRRPPHSVIGRAPLSGTPLVEMALPEPVRRQLSTFSRTVFTDTNRTGPEGGEAAGSSDNEVVASLPLQMSLYFNAFYFPFWWLCDVVMLQLKYSVLPDYYKFILVTVLILVSLIEAIRLYLGYTGNLQEKVPELAGFWLLSLLLQFPLVLFLLLNEGLEPQPLERATNIIFALFLLFQVLAAFLTLKRMVNHLATRFHLRDFDRLEGGQDKATNMDFIMVATPSVLPGAACRPMDIGWGSGLQA